MLKCREIVVLTQENHSTSGVNFAFKSWTLNLTHSRHYYHWFMWVTRKLLWEGNSRPNFGEEMWLLFFFFLRWWHGKTHRCSVAIYSQKVQLLIRCTSLFLCLFLSSVFRMFMLRMLVFQESATCHVLFSTLLHILTTMLSKSGNWHWERGYGISPKS